MSKMSSIEWIRQGLTMVPIWTTEPPLPTIESTLRTTLSILPSTPFTITLHTTGTFSKTYKATTPIQTFFIRLNLPVYPSVKTTSEVSTLEFLSSISFPAPKVLAFEASTENPIGFEYIITSALPGTPLASKWRKLFSEAKSSVIAQLASLQTILLSNPLPQIGSPSPEAVSSIVTPDFFTGANLTFDVPRGPFPSSASYLSAYLRILQKQEEKLIASANAFSSDTASINSDALEEAESRLTALRKLAQTIPTLFTEDPEQGILQHHELILDDIFIDDECKITGITGWSCAVAQPAWQVMRLPKFLTGATRAEVPDRMKYASTSDEPSDGLDNEGLSSLFWIHQMEFEKTALQEKYIQAIRSFVEGWNDKPSDVTRKNTFLTAVQWCAGGLSGDLVTMWAAKLTQGEFKPFMSKNRLVIE